MKRIEKLGLLLYINSVVGYFYCLYLDSWVKWIHLGVLGIGTFMFMWSKDKK